MSGVKGRSGGARPNTGGRRPGAGRKPARAAETPSQTDSLEFLRGVMNDGEIPVAQRVRAAIAVAQYEHIKLNDGGKKQAKGDAAETAGTGKFAPTAAPPLKLVKV